MGSFLTGIGCAVVVAAVTYFGLLEFGVSSTERTADSSVNVEQRSVEYDSIMIEPTH